jgi:hypothetical protein
VRIPKKNYSVLTSNHHLGDYYDPLAILPCPLLFLSHHRFPLLYQGLLKLYSLVDLNPFVVLLGPSLGQMTLFHLQP